MYAYMESEVWLPGVGFLLMLIVFGSWRAGTITSATSAASPRSITAGMRRTRTSWRREARSSAPRTREHSFLRHCLTPTKRDCGSAELFYLYDGTNSGPSASVAQPVFTKFSGAEDALARQAVGFWSSFAMTLSPNTFAVTGAPTWDPAARGGFMVLDSNRENGTAPDSGMAARSEDYPRRCAWWRSVADDLRL